MTNFTSGRTRGSAERLQTRTRPFCLCKRLLLAAALACACALLAGCGTVAQLTDSLTVTPQADTAGPNLALLTLPDYHDTDGGASGAATDAQPYASVDLWLDATPNMGGVNTSDSDMYPHLGKKYREGGFQYQYGGTTGWYENLLGDFLIAAGDARVRVLRYGNETFPDGALARYGLAGKDESAAASVWRDLHTSAVNADAMLFASMTAEDMTDSFYTPGSATWVNRIDGLDTQALENPTLSGAMSAALNEQIAGIAAGDARYTLDAGRDGQQCALYAALKHIDPDRLSVITVDPASVRDLSGADASGQPIGWYEQLLREQGVFDAGLCVGLLDFQLDYLGQMSTVCSATLSEPLIWGRLILYEKTQNFHYIGAMPRRMLTLVIGSRALVDGFITRMTEAIQSDSLLRGLRGPTEGELTYAANGQTVTQQPFAFAWNQTVIARPGMGLYTQKTAGTALSADAQGATVATAASGLPLLQLPASVAGASGEVALTVRFPILPAEGGATLDVSALNSAGVDTLHTLLLDSVLPNTQANRDASANAQTIAYRDKLYVYRDGQASGTFRLTGITREGDELVCSLAADCAALQSGYYRLRVTADATGKQVAWESVPWIDGAQSVSASVSDRDFYAWQSFTAAITQYDRNAKSLQKMFQHAWGGYTDKLYHGIRVPDFPPIYRSIRLKEFADQVRAAAASDVSPLIRYAFEVFVPNP